MSGASGLIGSALKDSIEAAGGRCVPLVRPGGRASDGVPWDPDGGVLDAAALEGFDAVVHLGGENIAAGRWTAARKERILQSRVGPTRLLAERLALCQQRPAVFVCASAVGYYGDRGDEVLDEAKGQGQGFLPQVCAAWEEATGPAVAAGVRVVNLRFGMVLSGEGGALQKMLTPFKLGLGGRLGSGRQYMSWIERSDAVAAIVHAIERDEVGGPLNLAAPQPLTNAEFTRALGRVLGRPTFVPAPAWGLRLALGEMADELLLASARVVPQKLESSGFAFRYGQLDAALEHLLR